MLAYESFKMWKSVQTKKWVWHKLLNLTRTHHKYLNRNTQKLHVDAVNIGSIIRNAMPVGLRVRLSSQYRPPHSLLLVPIIMDIQW